MNQGREQAKTRWSRGSGRRMMSGSGLFLTAILFVLSMSHGAMAQGNMNQIQHIIFLVRENRSFDHYFGLFPGADGASTAPIFQRTDHKHWARHRRHTPGSLPHITVRRDRD